MKQKQASRDKEMKDIIEQINTDHPDINENNMDYQ